MNRFAPSFAYGGEVTVVHDVASNEDLGGKKRELVAEEHVHRSLNVLSTIKFVVA